ncbi:MAG: response regulator [Planctomycetota bacterium]|jgi:CheY-like chemotaxis protein
MANEKILVVDDDQDIRDSLQSILEGQDYIAVTAANRIEGMEKIKNEKPDLIILDVMMASWLDGLDMSKTLKEDPELKDIPILMLTGVKEKTGVDFRPKADGPDWCSVDSYLDKPVIPDILLAEVEKLLSERA